MRVPSLLLILLLVCIQVGFCQKKVDSLLIIASSSGSNAKSFYAFKQLGELTNEKSPKKAIAYYRQALTFPLQTAYAKDFVEICNALGTLYRTQRNYDSSSLLHIQAIALSQKFNLNKELAVGYHSIAMNYLNQSSNDSARLYFEKALGVATQIKDWSMQASVYIDLGNVAIEENKLPEALEHFIGAAKIYEANKDHTGLGKAQANIANVQCILGQYDKALDYVELAQKKFEETSNERSLAYCYRLKGRIYRKQKKFDKAVGQYQNAMAIYQETHDLRNEGETHQNIGNIYFDLTNYPAAIGEYEKAIAIAKQINSLSLQAFNFSAMGSAWHELKQHNKALMYFDSSIKKANEVKNHYLVMDAYEMKSKIYENLNNYKEALKFHRLFSQLKDSVDRDENKQATQELEAKYQNAQKQTEIELLKKSQLLQTISLTQSRTLLIALIVTMILLLIIGLLLFNRNKVINHAKRQMEIERVRNQIARDLHDDMGSALSTINLISQVAIKDSSPESKLNYFQRIGEQSSKIMESMSDIVWSINPDNDSFSKMIAKMKEFCGEILEQKNIGFEFTVDESLHSISLDVGKRKNVFLIFKETVNNAAKYSEATFLNIQFLKAENGLLLTIRDNGKGFNPSGTSGGNGLRNMKVRAEEINAVLNLESSVGAGTSLVMVVPLT